MTMSVNNVIQLSVKSTFAGQRGLNVFHYQVTDPQATYDPTYVTTAFRVDVLAGLWANLNAGAVINAVEYRDLTNGVDLYEDAGTLAGSLAGEALPPFACYAFRLNRTSAITRHGQKRFWGCPETSQANGVVIPAQVTALNAWAAILAEPLLEDSQGQYNFGMVPVIVGRTLNAQGVYALDLNKLNYVGSAQFVSLSTQNTRKIGRGT